MWIWSPLWNLVGIVNLVETELWTVLRVMVIFLVGLVYSFIWFSMVGRGYVMNVSRSYVMTVGRGYVIQVITLRIHHINMMDPQVILLTVTDPQVILCMVLKAIWLDPEGYFVRNRVISNPQGYISGLGYLCGSLRLYEGFKECQA